MFPNMRRAKQELSLEECEKVLNRATSGVLSLISENGYPYGVPLSFVYANSKLYFHCAKVGHKIDALKNCQKVSFCVIDNDDIIPEKFTTAYRSVIVFGRARLLEEKDEIIRAVTVLSDKYSPNLDEQRDEEIRIFMNGLAVIEVEIDKISGKIGKELLAK